ncbi:MAG: hypothetical protein AAFX87_30155 [Bacteroidota bacterium]
MNQEKNKNKKGKPNTSKSIKPGHTLLFRSLEESYLNRAADTVQIS